MKLKQEIDFPFGPSLIGNIAFRIGSRFQITLDSWAETPTIWIVGAMSDRIKSFAVNLQDSDKTGEEYGLRIIQVKEGKCKVVFNFEENAKKDLISLSNGNNKKLYFSHKTEKLYISENRVVGTGMTTGFLPEIDPLTGKKRMLRLPFQFDDMDIDINGLIYLRTHTNVTRWELDPIREVPFDYGQNLPSPGFKLPEIMSAIMVPGDSTVCGYESGMSVNIYGDIAVHCHPPYSPKLITKKFVGSSDINDTATYTPIEFAGRQESSVSGLIHIWDKYGKLVITDAVGGNDKNDGIQIDKDRNLYILTVGSRLIAGNLLDDGNSSTLIKFKKGAKGRLLSKNGGVLRLTSGEYPKRPPDLRTGGGDQWVVNNEWLYGGVGFAGFGLASHCACVYPRWKLDYFARTLVPAPMLYEVHMLDSAGNLILKIGQYGNEDSKGKNSLEPLGGDEVGLFHPCFVATHTDRRVFISDFGTGRILSVKLRYVVDETLPLKILK